MLSSKTVQSMSDDFNKEVGRRMEERSIHAGVKGIPIDYKRRDCDGHIELDVEPETIKNLAIKLGFIQYVNMEETPGLRRKAV